MYKHLLVPLDAPPPPHPPLGRRHARARPPRASVTGRLIEPPSAHGASGHGASHHLEAMEQQRDADARHAERVLGRFQDEAAAAGVPFEGVYGRARQVDAAIVDVARRRGCDMIVMVTHGRGPFGELLFGACTKAVMARSPVPLLVLHAESRRAPGGVAAP